MKWIKKNKQTNKKGETRLVAATFFYVCLSTALFFFSFLPVFLLLCIAFCCHGSCPIAWLPRRSGIPSCFPVSPCKIRLISASPTMFLLDFSAHSVINGRVSLKKRSLAHGSWLSIDPTSLTASLFPWCVIIRSITARFWAHSLAWCPHARLLYACPVSTDRFPMVISEFMLQRTRSNFQI